MVRTSKPPSELRVKRHILCERDVGLFSLIQQVIANIPWALSEDRTPIVYFQDKTCYWTPKGYHGKDTVWEYYFEPVVSTHPVCSIPRHIRNIIAARWPSPFDAGYFADEHTFVSSHFGDHPDLNSKSLSIPFLLDDPDHALRHAASIIIDNFVRPRPYIQKKASWFFKTRMSGRHVIGVHARRLRKNA
jgi:hypothetical protein